MLNKILNQSKTLLLFPEGGGVSLIGFLEGGPYATQIRVADAPEKVSVHPPLRIINGIALRMI